MSVTIQVNHGAAAGLPALADGEPGWTTDTHALYVGQGGVNYLINTSYSDEQAQDAVGGILTDTATIDFTYNDGANTITADVINASITYAKIQNVSATSRVLARKTAAAGSVEECTLSEVLDFVGSAAKGDILVRTATAWTRLAVGADGYILTADSTQADGVKWDVPPADLLYSNTSVPAGNTVANTTLETLFTSNYTSIPANSLQPGDVVRLTLYGTYGTANPTGTLTLTIYWKKSIVAGNGTAMIVTVATVPVSMTNRQWTATATFIVQATGTGGTSANPVEAQGHFLFSTSGTTGTLLFGEGENTSPIAVDLTHDIIVQASAQWSAANASNTVTLREMVLEFLEAA